MNAFWVMVGAALLSPLCAAAVLGGTAALGVLVGVVGPLVAALITRYAVDVAHRKSPASVMRVLMVGFVAKMVFYGAYVAVVLLWFSARPLPFVVSFTSFFLGFYAIEALHLRRLFSEGGSLSPR